MAIDLAYLEDFLGLIVEDVNGPLHTNQICGVSCLREQIHGFYIPLQLPETIKRIEQHIVRRNTFAGETQPWLCDGSDLAYTSEACERALTQLGVDHLLEPRRDFSGTWGEAWIPVTIRNLMTVEDERLRGDNHFELLSDFYGRNAILTYENCD